MLLHIQHETKLIYSEPVTETVFEVRMAPPSDDDQTNLGYRLRISPAAPVTIYRDGFGNRIELFNILSSYHELIIQATSIVRVHRQSPESRLARAESHAGRDESFGLDSGEYLQPSPLVKPCRELDDFVQSVSQPRGNVLDTIQSLGEAVRARLAYEKKVTTAHARRRGAATRAGRLSRLCAPLPGGLSRNRSAGAVCERLRLPTWRGRHACLVPGMAWQRRLDRR